MNEEKTDVFIVCENTIAKIHLKIHLFIFKDVEMEIVQCVKVNKVFLKAELIIHCDHYPQT